MDWQPIATQPKDGRMILVFRPLAHKTFDEPIRMVATRETNQPCWPSTVPDGSDPTNYTNGACHCTHWMPLPEPPTDQS